MIEDTSAALRTGLLGTRDNNEKPLTGNFLHLTGKSFVNIGAVALMAGASLIAGMVYTDAEPLETVWGYPVMLLGAAVAITGALMIARGVGNRSLLDD